eukprot:11578594-Alexandrium_andersonii.AAC.1
MGEADDLANRSSKHGNVKHSASKLVAMIKNSDQFRNSDKMQAVLADLIPHLFPEGPWRDPDYVRRNTPSGTTS